MRKYLLKNDVTGKNYDHTNAALGCTPFEKLRQCIIGVKLSVSKVEFNTNSHLSLRVQRKKITCKSDIIAEF